MSEKSVLLSFQISPVQTFIAQARKTVDLFGGSSLLSHLIDVAINNLPSDSKLIFPNKDLATKPNRFIARLSINDDTSIKDICEKMEKNDDTSIKDICEKMEKAVRDEIFVKASDSFTGVFRQALKNLGCSDNTIDNCCKKNDVQNQLTDFFHVSWAVIPSSESYCADFHKLEKIMGGVKNIRKFSNAHGETGRKCSLCGERKALFCGKDSGPSLKSQTILCFQVSKVRKNEGLCAVCLTKRFFSNTSFPSTAGIALLHTINELKKTEGVNCPVEAFKAKFQTNFDEQLFYIENLNENYFDKYGVVLIPDMDLQKLKKEHKKLADKVKELNLSFNKYYAIIILDGDDMGKWLSGEYLSDNQHLDFFQKILSEKTLEYAKQVKALFPEKSTDTVNPDNLNSDNLNNGRLVYAGGDDLLAFVNINQLMKVLGKLGELPNFHETGKDGTRYIIPGKTYTASAGIVIAHYKSPLSEVLKLCRSVHDEAKNVDGKNAVAMGLMPHSGNLLKTVFKWKHLDILKKLTVGMQNTFSDSFVYTLKTEMLPVFEGNSWRYEELGYICNIMESETKRLLKRSKKELVREDQNSSDSAIKALTGNNLTDFILFNINQAEHEYQFDIYNIISMMEIARFLAKETIPEPSAATPEEQTENNNISLGNA